jgi:hypothetical protein
MKWRVAALIFVPVLLGAAPAKHARPPKQAKIIIETSRPNSPFDCDTAKAREWYGSEKRCREDLCRGRNETNAYIDGPDGRLRQNPCDHRRRE